MSACVFISKRKGKAMNIREEALGLAPYIVEQRRYLHRHPECSFKEKATTAYLATELEKMGILLSMIRM